MISLGLGLQNGQPHEMLCLNKGKIGYQRRFQVVYRSKDGKNDQSFHTIDGFAAMCSHVPDKGEQMIHYNGSLIRSIGEGETRSSRIG